MKLNEVQEMFYRWLNGGNLHKHGIKVKEIETGDIWILAAVKTCYYQWINTRTGCRWGDSFVNSDDPFSYIKQMEYELILPYKAEAIELNYHRTCKCR